MKNNKNMQNANDFFQSKFAKTIFLRLNHIHNRTYTNLNHENIFFEAN